MTSKIHTDTLVAVVVVGVVATSVALPTGCDGTKHNMNCLGTVDGKSYYNENKDFRTWAEAKQFCEDSGMQLATITSQLQAQFLDNAYNNVTFFSEHWVAGIETQKLVRFDWAYTNKNINETFVSLVGPPIPEGNNCLTYWSQPTQSVYHVHHCFLVGLRTLCEIIH